MPVDPNFDHSYSRASYPIVQTSPTLGSSNTFSEMSQTCVVKPSTSTQQRSGLNVAQGAQQPVFMLEEKDIDAHTMLSILCGAQYANQMPQQESRNQSPNTDFTKQIKLSFRCFKRPVEDKISQEKRISPSVSPAVHDVSDPLDLSSLNLLDPKHCDGLNPSQKRRASEPLASQPKRKKRSRSAFGLKKRRRSLKTHSKEKIECEIKELAKLTYCRSEVDQLVYRKASSTIKSLSKQSEKLEVILNNLQDINKDLDAKRSRLLSSIAEDRMIHHVGIHSPKMLASGIDIGALKRGLDKVPASAKSPGISEIFNLFENAEEEPYEENYGVFVNSNFDIPCGNSFCRFGCICESLNSGTPLLDHCQIPQCMFECTCCLSDGEDGNEGKAQSPLKVRVKATPMKILKSPELVVGPMEKKRTRIMVVDGQLVKGKPGSSTNRILRRNLSERFSATQSGVFDEFVLLDSDVLKDQKLFLRSNVCLKIMNLNCMEEKESHVDQKLVSGVFVSVCRIPVTEKHNVYCMQHTCYRCPCLLKKTVSRKSRKRKAKSRSRK